MQSDRNLLNFANQYLFDPLGITNYSWQRIRGEYYFASGGLSLRPRDMAKIGQLFLNNGLWEGEQIISSEWIEASMKSYVVPDMNITSGYGYQWWVPEHTNGISEIFAGNGFGGQYLMMSPEYNLIVVFNGWNINDEPEKSTWRVLQDRIISTLKNK